MQSTHLRNSRAKLTDRRDLHFGGIGNDILGYVNSYVSGETFGVSEINKLRFVFELCDTFGYNKKRNFHRITCNQRSCSNLNAHTVNSTFQYFWNFAKLL